MNIVERIKTSQSGLMRSKLPQKPTTSDLQVATDLILGESLIALSSILNESEDAGEKIKAANSATNIARYLEVRKAAERDSSSIMIDYDDPVLELGMEVSDGDD